MKTPQVGALQVHTGTKVSCALGVKYLSVWVYHLGTVRLFSWVARAVSESFISSFISRGVHRSHALIWRELPGASWAPYCSLRLLHAAGGPSIEYERIAQTRTPTRETTKNAANLTTANLTELVIKMGFETPVRLVRT